MSTQSINRQPAGTPTGGRFAPTFTGESAASLVAANDSDRWAQARVRELDSQLQDAGWDSHRVEAEDDSVSVHLPDGTQYRVTPLRAPAGEEYVVEHSFMSSDPQSGPYGETVEVGTHGTASGAVDLLMDHVGDRDVKPTASTYVDSTWVADYGDPPF